MTAADDVGHLLRLLDLEAIDDNIYRGSQSGEDRQRVFGGQVLGQALVAAQRTVEVPRLAHSLHGYFLRPGDPTIPIVYEVDRIRDGKSFTTRRVVAIQHGRAIFNMAVSFQVPEDGAEYQLEMPEVPSPDQLQSWTEFLASIDPHPDFDIRLWTDRPYPIDSRPVNPIAPWATPAVQPPRQQLWFRTSGAVPNDPGLHQAIITYAVDMWLLDCSTMAHGLSYLDPHYQVASLDHAMWFQRPVRADEWLLLDAEAVSTSGARGINRAAIYSADGTLVATAHQEGLIRYHPEA